MLGLLVVELPLWPFGENSGHSPPTLGVEGGGRGGELVSADAGRGGGGGGEGVGGIAMETRRAGGEREAARRERSK